MIPKEQPYLNGMCYVYKYSEDHVSVDTAAKLMSDMNVKSMRSWCHISWLLDSPYKVNADECRKFHRMHKAMYTAGVAQIVGMSHTWFYTEDCQNIRSDMFSVPSRDTSTGSVYMRFLELYEISWYTLAKEFTEIRYWETGNEHNHDPFLHPLNYTDDTDNNIFTLREKAEISVDMMFFAAKGIRRANPDAVIIMPGMAPVAEKGLGVVGDNVSVDYGGMVKTLDTIYRIILGSESFSDDPRDFFDALAWHPYYAVQNEDLSWKWQIPDEKWIKLNLQVYDVAVQNGDDGIDCYFSEFGFNDFGSDEIDAELTEHIVRGIDIIRSELPFVANIHAYRLFEYLDVENQTDTYSFFKVRSDGVHAKKRAIALQKAYGGHGDLTLLPL